MALRFSWKLSLTAFLMLAMMASQATSRSLNEGSMTEKHEQWMAQHGRVYKDDAEKADRYKIFKENVNFIAAARNKYKPWKVCESKSFMYENVSAVPASMDWRKKGAVTGVKDQGQCGCCWAFSAVAAMEGINQLTTGKLISLSEQELVDCDTAGEDEGCGLTTETNYPYQGTDGTCNANKEANHAAKITGYEDVPANSEAALLKAVANQPVSVAIDASGSAFQFYSSGVFTGDCGTELDHGVTAVGYGTSTDGTKYWLVKNSWGTSWGENGYIRMQRDIDAKEGLCGIAMQASYPTGLKC
ncbi:unnamed protein product [Coffea canephora]|uniref:Peptidase C1A papain C-terminal domain-containing protein n=1 Tax=Coffea canephora TaxID=49390 RepID=A0A068UCU4_COFCA|nr:unnamed protein product [Coffea canephora]